MVLADTNLIIYATRPDYAVVANCFFSQHRRAPPSPVSKRWATTV